MLKKFYFTFGTSKEYPFCGGWVEILAENRSNAIAVFREHYPDRHTGVLNCCDIYTEQEFLDSHMLSGNRGACCHSVFHQPLTDDDFLCKQNDVIDNTVFQAINAISHKDNKLTWDMNIIGEVTDAIKQILLRHHIAICHPWHDEDNNICYSTEKRCPHCTK